MNTMPSIEYICGATRKSIITSGLIFFASQITFKVTPQKSKKNYWAKVFIFPKDLKVSTTIFSYVAEYWSQSRILCKLIQIINVTLHIEMTIVFEL